MLRKPSPMSMFLLTTIFKETTKMPKLTAEQITILESNADNVAVVKLALNYVRDAMLEDADVPDELIEALDTMQAVVFHNDAQDAFIIIHIHNPEV